MAKFGYLFLKEGLWQNEQIISKEWVNISTQNHIDPAMYGSDFPWADGYGYQWWIWEDIYGRKVDAYMASGWGGQWIIIFPELDMVVVSTAGNYYTDTIIPIEHLLVQYILPAIHD
jgi:CubicO group peptidase (beta-lactamase class C family)